MNNTLSNALRIIGEESSTFNQILINMVGQNGEEWKRELRKFARREPCWFEVAQAPAPSILELVKPEIKVSARKKFVVADHFKKGVAGIYFVSNNFQKWFGNRVEENVPAGTLSSRKLLQNSVDGPIKAELGEGHETFLAWLFEKIEAQSDSRKGELLVNGYANIWYVDGFVVDAFWFAGYGWYVYARGVTDPGEWGAGYLVFSRNRPLGTQA